MKKFTSSYNRMGRKIVIMAADEPLSKAAPTRRMTVCSKGFERLTGRRCVFFPIISLSVKWL
ncbi:MAG: hypothetical protein KF862_05120 [Chitinophagaceae bacterium]|nr:hypothetical protein [Chitinophagaceae bacterium]